MPTQPNPLTAREFQVALGLAAGDTNREIADVLKISIKTVDTHRAHVLKKLGLRNNVALAHFAIQQGWIAIDGVQRIASLEEIGAAVVAGAPQ